MGELAQPGFEVGVGAERVEADDGKQVAYSGDGWVFAVEFGETPRAYSVLAYGQSSREDSPHLTDQLEMFARGEMKRVAFTEEVNMQRNYEIFLIITPNTGINL